jgi:hypothetical protein
MNNASRFAAQWWQILLIAFAIIAAVRGIALVTHGPLLAFANNYDQIRELACLDIGPWRPGVNAGVANPVAPLSRFSFQPLSRDACVWTTDLALTAPVVIAWRVAEAFGGGSIHSVRLVAEFRLLLWFAAAFWATHGFLRAGRSDVAVAHLAWLSFIGMDPANTLYLATFYSEPAAVFSLYLAVVAATVAVLRPTTNALLLAAAGGFVLAGSKLQHLMLPILIGACFLAAGGRASRKAALALFVGGALGCALQIGNQTRDTWMIRDVAMINRMDYVLTVLLEDTSDRARVVRALALDDECLSHHGKNVFEIEMPSEQACRNNAEWRKATMWWLLLSDPAAMFRAAARVPVLLLPWLPEKLGVVEGKINGRLPSSNPSIASLLGASTSAAAVILLMPWLVLLASCIRRGFPLARTFALVCAVGSASVCAVALLGDGTADFDKHAHLAPSLALSSLLVPLAGLVSRLSKRTAPVDPISAAIESDLARIGEQ